MKNLFLVCRDHQYQCLHCGKLFHEKQSLRVHIICHRKFTNNRYKCDQCNKSYTQTSSLAVHKRVQHKLAGGLDFICDYCGKGFASRGNLRAHVRYVHEKVVVAVCPVCEMGFVEKMRLKRHLKLHTGERSYRCDICKFEFIRKSHKLFKPQ